MSLGIEVKQENGTLVSLSGRLDTMTTPELEKEMEKILPEAERLTLDFAGLEYISSAGLRLLLKAQKEMSKKGGMKLVNVNAEIAEIFEITGFSEFLTVE